MPDASSTLAYAPSGVRAPRFDRLLFWYAFAWTGLTLFNLTAGASVTSHGAGLSVPDWPTTFHQNMFTFPLSKMVGGIFYEHGHRLVASTVGFMTIGLVALLYLRESRRWLRRLGMVALAAVIVQGVLGGLTVLFYLPDPVSVSHAGLAQLFFCTAASITLFLSRGWIEARPQPDFMRGAGLWKPAAAATAFLFVQILLGAVVRHTESGLAIPDFPLSYGRLIPSLDDASIDAYNHQRRWGDVDNWLPQTSARQIAVHFAHRVNAVLATVILVVMAVRVIRACRGRTWLTRPAWTLLLLLPVQIGLGAATVLTQRDVLPNTAHVIVGASLLATCVVLTLRLHRLHPAAAPRPVLHAAEFGVRGAPA